MSADNSTPAPPRRGLPRHRTRVAPQRYNSYSEEPILKIFWAIILVLALTAAVLLARGEGDAAPEAGLAETAPMASAAPPPPPPSTTTTTTPVAPPPRTTSPAAAPTAEQPAEQLSTASPPAPDAAAAPVDRDEAGAEGQVGADAGMDEAEAVTAAEEVLPGEEGSEQADSSPAAPAADEGRDHDAEAAERARQVAEQAAAARGAEAAAADAEPSGPSLRINDKWTVPGDGTAERPFEVPWDLLVSAGREYNPREGKTELPEWAAQLDGKRVRLTGFLLFPIVATDADELLVMYNQWDGCCIGIPPTPYDSVEVKLAKPAAKDAWRFNYGSVTGTLRVDPYLAGKWLVSLYVLEGAELEARGL